MARRRIATATTPSAKQLGIEFYGAREVQPSASEGGIAFFPRRRLHRRPHPPAHQARGARHRRGLLTGEVKVTRRGAMKPEPGTGNREPGWPMAAKARCRAIRRVRSTPRSPFPRSPRSNPLHADRGDRRLRGAGAILTLLLRHAVGREQAGAWADDAGRASLHSAVAASTKPACGGAGARAAAGRFENGRYRWQLDVSAMARSGAAGRHRTSRATCPRRRCWQLLRVAGATRATSRCRRRRCGWCSRIPGAEP